MLVFKLICPLEGSCSILENTEGSGSSASIYRHRHVNLDCREGKAIPEIHVLMRINSRSLQDTNGTKNSTESKSTHKRITRHGE